MVGNALRAGYAAALHALTDRLGFDSMDGKLHMLLQQPRPGECGCLDTDGKEKEVSVVSVPIMKYILSVSQYKVEL